MAAVERQDPIEVFTNEDGDIVIQQEQMGETVSVFVAKQNAKKLAQAIAAEAKRS